MVFKAIQKSSTPQIIAEQILRRIEAGELKAGERLPSQRELAEQLAVGRSSLREAINALMVMGYLEVRQGSGTYVHPEAPVVDASMRQLAEAFKAVGLLELMEARETLECKSAALAAERADGDHLRRLEAHVRDLEHNTGNYRLFLKSDVQFHTLLAEAAGNAVILELTKLLLAKLVRQHGKLQTQHLSFEYRTRSAASAREIIRAVEQADAEAAARWMQAHLGTIRDELKTVLSAEFRPD